MFKKLRERKGSKNIKPDNIKSQWAAIKENGYKFSEIKDWANTVCAYFNNLSNDTQTIGKVTTNSVVRSTDKPSSYPELKEHIYATFRHTGKGEKEELRTSVSASWILAEYVVDCPIRDVLKDAARSGQRWTECPTN